MKTSKLLFIVALIVAAPAVADETIFNNGFEDGTLCAWGPSGCAIITLLDDSATAPVSGHEEWADYVVQFAVHAGNRDLHFEKEAARSVSPNLTKGFWFSIESNSATYNGGITPFSMSATCPCNDTPTHFKVAANTTRTFWVSVRLDNTGGTDGFYRMRITGLSYKFDGTNGDAATLITASLSNLVTSLVHVDDQDVGNLGIGTSSYDDFHNNL